MKRIDFAEQQCVWVIRKELSYNKRGPYVKEAAPLWRNGMIDCGDIATPTSPRALHRSRAIAGVHSAGPLPALLPRHWSFLPHRAAMGDSPRDTYPWLIHGAGQLTASQSPR